MRRRLKLLALLGGLSTNVAAQSPHPQTARQYCTADELKQLNESAEFATTHHMSPNLPSVMDDLCNVIYWWGLPDQRTKYTTEAGSFMAVQYSTIGLE